MGFGEETFRNICTKIFCVRAILMSMEGSGPVGTMYFVKNRYLDTDTS